MKKNDKIFWAIYLMAGVVMIAVGLKLDIEYYSTLIFAIGVSFAANAVARIAGHWYHMRPVGEQDISLGAGRCCSALWEPLS